MDSSLPLRLWTFRSSYCFFFFALAILGLSLKLQNQLLRKYKQMPPAFLVSLRISGLTDQVSKLWSASFKLLYRKQTGNFTTHAAGANIETDTCQKLPWNRQKQKKNNYECYKSVRGHFHGAWCTYSLWFRPDSTALPPAMPSIFRSVAFSL